MFIFQTFKLFAVSGGLLFSHSLVKGSLGVVVFLLVDFDLGFLVSYLLLKSLDGVGILITGRSKLLLIAGNLLLCLSNLILESLDISLLLGNHRVDILSFIIGSDKTVEGIVFCILLIVCVLGEGIILLSFGESEVSGIDRIHAFNIAGSTIIEVFSLSVEFGNEFLILTYLIFSIIFSLGSFYSVGSSKFEFSFFIINIAGLIICLPCFSLCFDSFIKGSLGISKGFLLSLCGFISSLVYNLLGSILSLLSSLNSSVGILSGFSSFTELS